MLPERSLERFQIFNRIGLVLSVNASPFSLVSFLLPGFFEKVGFGDEVSLQGFVCLAGFCGVPI